MNMQNASTFYSSLSWQCWTSGRSPSCRLLSFQVKSDWLFSRWVFSSNICFSEVLADGGFSGMFFTLQGSKCPFTTRVSSNGFFPVFSKSGLLAIFRRKWEFTSTSAALFVSFVSLNDPAKRLSILFLALYFEIVRGSVDRATKPRVTW